jgi:hypothetical protein
MLRILPMITPNFVEKPPVKASKATNQYSSPAQCLAMQAALPRSHL